MKTDGYTKVADTEPVKRNTTKIRLRVPVDALQVTGQGITTVLRGSMPSDDGYYNVDISVPCAEELDMKSAQEHLKKLGYKEYEIDNLIETMLDSVWPTMCIRALKDYIVPVRDGGYAVTKEVYTKEVV